METKLDWYPYTAYSMEPYFACLYFSNLLDRGLHGYSHFIDTLYRHRLVHSPQVQEDTERPATRITARLDIASPIHKALTRYVKVRWRWVSVLMSQRPLWHANNIFKILRFYLKAF